MTDRIATARKRIEEVCGVEPFESIAGLESDTLQLTRAVIELAAVMEAVAVRGSTAPRYSMNPAHRNGHR